MGVVSVAHAEDGGSNWEHLPLSAHIRGLLGEAAPASRLALPLVLKLDRRVLEQLALHVAL